MLVSLLIIQQDLSKILSIFPITLTISKLYQNPNRWNHFHFLQTMQSIIHGFLLFFLFLRIMKTICFFRTYSLQQEQLKSLGEVLEQFPNIFSLNLHLKYFFLTEIFEINPQGEWWIKAWIFLSFSARFYANFLACNLSNYQSSNIFSFLINWGYYRGCRVLSDNDFKEMGICFFGELKNLVCLEISLK